MNNKNYPFDPNDWDLQDPSRRRLLMHLLCYGALGAMPYTATQAAWFGKKKLADDRSIFRLKGEVSVNGKAANKNTRIYAGDTVRTGKNGRIVFAVGADAFILRGASELEIGGSGFFIDSLRILTGRLLSVFAKRSAGQRLDMSASTATIGIRGSGVYLESEPELTYLCTCYGRVAISASEDPDDSEMIESRNHDQPRYIARVASQGSRIRAAPVINHDNEELELLEALVGRKTPTGFGKESYEK